MSLEGQVAVITGGGSGIGLGIAQALDRRGCRLVLAGRNAERIDRAVSGLREAVGVSRCDVQQGEAIERLFARAIDAFGTVDILVTSAGIARSEKSKRHVPSPVHALDEEVWRDILDTNLRGVFLAARAAARIMVPRRKGQIVNISSARAGRRGMAYGAAYCASKMAAVALLEAMADEVRNQGIRVMNFLPDVVETDMLRGTELNKGGALTTEQVGECVAELLAQPGDVQLDLPALVPLGARGGRPRRGSSKAKPAENSI